MKKQKENSHEGITWSEMGKQNVQAEKVYLSPMISGVRILKYLRKVLYQRTTCTAKDPGGEGGGEKALETKLDYCHYPVAQSLGGRGGSAIRRISQKALQVLIPG